MLLHFQALAFLKEGWKSVAVLTSSRAHPDLAAAMISPDPFSPHAEAPSSLSVPTRCNSNSCLLHQHVPSQQLYPKSGWCFSTNRVKSNCARSQLVPDLELAVVVKWTLGRRKWVTPPGLQAVSTDLPKLTIPMDAWIYVTVRLWRFSLSTGVNLDCFPKRRLGSSFHFQAQKSKFHLWVLQITKNYST